MAQQAAKRGIFVNAIYCGGPDDGDALSWRQLAGSGTGTFSHIDHNRGTVNVTTPYDKELTELSGQLNGTYVFYGVERLAAKKRQAAQDDKAKEAGAPAAAQRAEAKAGKLYKAPKDLVGRLDDEGFDLGEVADEDLPAALRELDAAGRKAYLEKKAAERARIQARIKELSAKRAAHVKKVMDEKQLDDKRSLDRALRDAVREQAARKGFQVESGGSK
jgi:hypothetical protein